MLCDALDARVVAVGDPLARVTVLVDFSLLVPEGACGRRLAVAQELFARGGERALPLLRHPLLQALLYLEWRRRRHAALVSLHLVVYVAYVGALAAYLVAQPSVAAARDGARAALLALATTAGFVALPFVLLGGVAEDDRFFAFITKVCPAIVTLAGLASDYRPLLVFGFIMSWLAVLHFTNVVSAINYKFAMFQYIMRKLVDHLLVFAFILTGFSVAFFLLYGGDPEARFRTLWEASLSTTLMLLQGDLTGTPLFRGSAGPGDDPPVLPPDILVAGGLMQQLFVVIAVLALLNMWVGLAVRGGRELERQGHIHYSRNQVRTLAVLDRVLGWAQAVFGCAPAAAAAAPLTGPRALSDADAPPDLLAALRAAALRHRRRARRPAPAHTRAAATRASSSSSSAAGLSDTEDDSDAGGAGRAAVARLAGAVRRLAARVDRLAGDGAHAVY